MPTIGKFTSILNKSINTVNDSFNEIFKKLLLEYEIDSVNDLNNDKKQDFYNHLHELLSNSNYKIIGENKEDNKTDYQKFFKKKLDKYGVKSPSQLDDNKKKKFFAEIESEWKGKKDVKENFNKDSDKNLFLEKYSMFRDKIFSHIGENFDETLKVYYDTMNRIPDNNGKIALTYYFKECLKINRDLYTEEQKNKVDKILGLNS